MIYLDNSATTMVDSCVLDTFVKVSMEYPGNANSLHKLGVRSLELMEYATSKIAKIFNAKAGDVIYTSGASESNNTVFKGIASRYGNRGKRIITTYLEHSSILECANYLESKGFTIEYVNILSDGSVDLEDLDRLMGDDVILVSIALVDSELGIKQDIKGINKIVRKYPKCYLHFDCTQAVGKIKIDFNDMDFLSMSAHKIYGLKGIGLLLKRENIVIDNLIHGGKSTTNYRSGTPALPLICSLMKALELVCVNMDDNYEYVSTLNKTIIDKIRNYPNIYINSTDKSIPYIINFSINNIKPETFIHAMEDEDIYISTRSACSKSDKSKSIMAVYHDEDRASHSIRVSLSYKNTKEEIEKFLDCFDRVYNKLNLK